ncbi:hypothetical protein [Pseudogemmobacter humi]|uniref:Uncharacterized protein n=1 Tax=Pseudogemmobacter humi TaxID=2483812 RepID=A0A3P5XYS4_9RHOB|nr:hypothetical protein [Pseudogemmobacter humi]VDC33303.1 hypothetical protein XINFAN_03750 [Pseudogemmobacter humi]
MRNRMRMLQAATALLYMGPLLGGLAGYGPALVVPFVSIFMLWLVLLRPHRWPQEAREWLTFPAWGAALTLLLSQTLFVAVLFGVGRGLGGVMGFLPMFHPLLPVAVSFLALPLMRLVWNPELSLESDETIDELIIRARRSGARPPAPVADDALALLLALSNRVGDEAEVMVGHLDRFLDTGDVWARLAALTEALDGAPPGQHEALRIAVILRATDPCPQPECAVPGELRTAFAAAGAAPDLLALLAVRGAALLRRIPGAAAHFPPARVVADLAADCAGDAAVRALDTLAAALRAHEEASVPEEKPLRAAAAAAPRVFAPAPLPAARGA